MSKLDTEETDPFESELGRASRARMEAIGFWGAVWSEADPPLHVRAAQDGDAHSLARLLCDDPSLAHTQESDAPNEAALHKAARGGQAACALVLTAHGASPFALNNQGWDALDVVLDSTAPEPSLLSTARILLDARERARIGARAADPMTALSVIYQDGGTPENGEQRRRETEEFERVRVLVGARRLRASRQDCPRLCAMLLRAEPPKHPAVSAALRIAVDAGHGGTARVLGDWLRLHAAMIDLADTPSPDPFPAQSAYRLCPACLAWWVSLSDPACPHCSAETEGEAAQARPFWWPWGKSDTLPPCLESQERVIHEALGDLAAREVRIWDSRSRVERSARSDRVRALETLLTQGLSTVRSLQAEYGHCLWSAEIAAWWNLLELAVADWEGLSFKECRRRIAWCGTLRGRWRSTLAAWERGDAAARLALGVHGEPDVVVQARQALYACGQVQQGLLEAQASLALREGGRTGWGGRLPVCPAEPYSARVRVMTDLARRVGMLGRRLEHLGKRGADSDG